jgi:hypothetical protein
VAVLGTVYWMQRAEPAAAAATQSKHTLVVHTEPTDATVRLGGVRILSQVPVPIEGSATNMTLLVEKPGFRSKSIEISSDKDQELYVSLSPSRN